jgi:hypothetical protein
MKPFWGRPLLETTIRLGAIVAVDEKLGGQVDGREVVNVEVIGGSRNLRPATAWRHCVLGVQRHP